jgi:hypothetical protein
MYFQDDAFSIRQRFVVREAKYSDALGSKVGGSSLVRSVPFDGCVLVAIQLDGQFQCGTVEVQDEWPKRMLPAELQTYDLASSDVLPDSGFSVRLIATESSGTTEVWC